MKTMKTLKRMASQLEKCDMNVWGCSSLGMYLLK